MFLLFLGLGAASVKAQVRIGGNAAPNASAVLDLNANDTNNGTKGLALPRVGLTSSTMLLPGVTSNLTGMLVYNTITTGGAGVNTIGIYFWNGATWVKASLPSTSAADSGKILMSNGYTWIAVPFIINLDTTSLNLPTRDFGSVTWTKVLDTTLPIPLQQARYLNIPAPGLTAKDHCYAQYAIITADNNLMRFEHAQFHNMASANVRNIRCYRPSI